MEKERIVTVKVLSRYFDTEQNKKMFIGSEVDCSKERAKVLIKAKVAEIVSIKYK